MFRALFAQPQETLHKQHLVYRVTVMSVGCTRNEMELSPLWSWCSQLTTRTQYIKCRLCSASWGYEGNARNIQRPLILDKLNKKFIKLISLYRYHYTDITIPISLYRYHYTDILWCPVNKAQIHAEVIAVYGDGPMEHIHTPREQNAGIPMLNLAVRIITTII
jgi:hypothetical protein